MLKKTIKFTDLDGNPAEEDAYFNLTKAEAIELNIRNDLEVIGRSRNNNEIMDTFKKILEASYGRKTGDGKFVKEGFAAFAASEAYSELFMEIWTDPQYAATFIRGILPAEAVAEMDVQQNKTDIPAHLANHPSMQGHKQAQPQSRREARDVPQDSGRSTDWDRDNPQTKTPEERAEVDPEYREFLAFKEAQKSQTPPERVSSPEEPQQIQSPPRDDLI